VFACDFSQFTDMFASHSEPDFSEEGSEALQHRKKLGCRRAEMFKSDGKAREHHCTRVSTQPVRRAVLKLVVKMLHIRGMTTRAKQMLASPAASCTPTADGDGQTLT
jgi:hypothetical protein